MSIGPGASRTSGERDAGAAHDALAAGFGLVATALLVASPWLVDRSGPEPFYKGPLIFPLLALGLVVAGAVPAAVRLIVAAATGRGVLRDLAWPWTGIKLLVLMCFFPAALAFIGLEATAVLFTFAGLWIAGYRHPGKAAAVAVAMAVVLHGAFKTILDVWFPSPWVMELVGAVGAWAI